MRTDITCLTGYRHPEYAKSFRDFGIPWELPNSGGWLLKRQIPGFQEHDAMWCYPLFACRNWSLLHVDLENIEHDLVTLSVVTDPFGEYDVTYLRRCFKEVVIPFKEHFVVDLHCDINDYVSRHHSRYARKALQHLHAEKCETSSELADDWIALYANLVKRHNIKGIQAFSRYAFETQLRVPGIVAFRAVYYNDTVGMLLWYIQDEVAYYHLGAFSDPGYKLRASFALFWTAIQYFGNSGLRWLNLGAGAGLDKNAEDGLTRFKRDWSTETRTAYFCGRIFDPSKYLQIVNAKGKHSDDYFPAYRVSEFS